MDIHLLHIPEFSHGLFAEKWMKMWKNTWNVNEIDQPTNQPTNTFTRWSSLFLITTQSHPMQSTCLFVVVFLPKGSFPTLCTITVLLWAVTQFASITAHCLCIPKPQNVLIIIMTIMMMYLIAYYNNNNRTY